MITRPSLGCPHMYAFVDHPRPRSLADYAAVTDRFVARMADLPGVLAVYQLGSVSDPGISDLDFLVVTGDGVRATAPPLSEVPAEDRYLILHAPFGIARGHLEAALSHSAFHNYRHLWGERLGIENDGSASSPGGLLQRQVALEYLVQMYVNLTVQRAFGVFKLRGLFLHVKALVYDLDFLEVTDHPLRGLVEQLVTWRHDWFTKPAPPTAICGVVDELHALLPEFLDRQIRQHGFYLPEPRFALAPNIALARGERLEGRRSGLLLPRALRRVGGTYFKLQHRLNRFSFHCPYEVDGIPDELAARFRFLSRLREYHADYLPGFLRPTSSLNAA